MRYNTITASQADCVRKIGNKKKVGRVAFQKALDNGSFGRFLDSLKPGSVTITPPPGCRIQTVHVRVKLDQEWQEAINDNCPDTRSDSNVRKVGHLYVPTGTEEVEEDLVLLNYPKGDGSWDRALAWAETQKMMKTVPREVFAISGQHPELYSTLGVNSMYTVATTECFFEGGRDACYVWWHSSLYEAGLTCIAICGHAYDWFVFRK